MLVLFILIVLGAVLLGIGVYKTPPFTEAERKERTACEERGEKPPVRPWRWYDTSAGVGALMIAVGLLAVIVRAFF